MTAWIADALIVLGLIVMTLGVCGIVRFPDVYTQLHASSKAAFLGISILLVATALGGGLSMLALGLGDAGWRSSLILATCPAED
jgi:monovalent cation/proton antiporter MnhG/PhaG subunit